MKCFTFLEKCIKQEARGVLSRLPEVSGLMKELMVISFMRKLSKPVQRMQPMKFLCIWIIGSPKRTAFNGLHYMYISLCKMKRPLWGQFWADFILKRNLLKLCPKDAFYQISEYLEFFKIHQILPLFASY